MAQAVVTSTLRGTVGRSARWTSRAVAVVQLAGLLLVTCLAVALVVAAVAIGIVAALANIH
jgi:hypothetical protein